MCRPRRRFSVSYMVAQLQFNGVRIERPLIFEIALVVSSSIVIDKSDGNDEGDQLFSTATDDLQQLPFFFLRDLILKVSCHVHQDVRILVRRRS